MAPPKILGNCNAAGCEASATGRGYCTKHYHAWRRHGTPIAPTYLDRARTRIARLFTPEPNSGCWLWTGCTHHFGHGRFVINGRGVQAHRIMWEFMIGEIPAGMCVCHKCDVPSCVNPDHLFLATNAENFVDMRQKNRHPFGERAGRAKLTEEQVRAIILDNRSTPKIGAAYGVSSVLISKIKRRKLWQHVVTADA